MSANPPQQGGGNGPANSPLLFFVALGFGVVFTNLWIIVGVKYCFRYNARARARANGEEDVNLQQMPRPHRRRREKKLMTVDEVNEKFPVTKYKTWRAGREAMGLPAEGGVTNSSRPASIHSHDIAERTDTALPGTTQSAGQTTAQPATVTSDKAFSQATQQGAVVETNRQSTDNPTSSVPVVIREDVIMDMVVTPSTAGEDKRLSDISVAENTTSPDAAHQDDDDEDHPQTAVPEELLNSVGDSCAICLDTIEDNDDIRGLTCGHAFHSGCIDPWLTVRRACCPLCKADYYIPKPRAEGEQDGSGRNRNGDGRNPQQPESVLLRSGFGRRVLFSRGMAIDTPRNPHSNTGSGSGRNEMRENAEGQRSFMSRFTGPSRTTDDRPVQETVTSGGNARGMFGFWGRRNGQAQTQETTPEMLEAGLAGNNGPSNAPPATTTRQA